MGRKIKDGGMIVVCSQCGHPNKVKKTLFREPILEILCEKCGSRTSIETGTTGVHGAERIHAKHEGNLFHRDMEPSKAVPVLENYPFEEDETAGYEEAPEVLPPASKKFTIFVAILMLVITITVVVSLFMSMYGRVKTADAVKAARTAIVENDVIASVTGSDLSVEVVHIQFAKKSGREELARIEMNLAGTAGSARVAVYMKRSGDDWVVVSIQYVEAATGRERPLSRL